MLFTAILLYLVLTLAVGRFASTYVKSASDFAIAGRSLPTYVVASGLFATWFGSETVMGASTEFLENGLLGVIEDPFGAALCLLLLGLFFARPLYRMNILTFSDYFNIRYDKRVEVISAFFMIPSYFGWIAAQLVAMAIILNAIVGFPFYVGVLLCSGVVLGYTYMGGMWSVSITDTIQTALIIVGLVFILVTFSSRIGSYEAVVASLPNDFFRFIPKENSLNNWLLYFSAWITIGWGSIPQQDVFQRVLSAKSERNAVVGALISAFMYLTLAFIPLLIAITGRYLYHESIPENAQMTIPNLVLNHTSLPIQILFFGALLSAILSTCSGAVLAPATVVAENILKPLYVEKISDQLLLRLMRLSVILVSVGSVILTFFKSNIYELVGESSALSLVALFVPLVGGMYWKRSSTLGAILSMILGTFSWIILNFVFHYELATFAAFGISCGGMIIGSFIKPNPVA